MRSGRRPMSAAAKAAHKEWTLTVLGAFTCEIQQLIPHICGGGHMDACHVLRKSFIRAETNTWDEADRLAAMFDLDNGLAGCRTGHNLFDSVGHGGVTYEDLPVAAREFAERYGWTWKLEADYGLREQAA